MINPEERCIIIVSKNSAADRTQDVQSCSTDQEHTWIVFQNNPRQYTYTHRRAYELTGQRYPLHPSDSVFVRGELWPHPEDLDVVFFADPQAPGGGWYHLRRRSSQARRWSFRTAAEVVIAPHTPEDEQLDLRLAYLLGAANKIDAATIKDQDNDNGLSLARRLEPIGRPHPDSALNYYLLAADEEAPDALAPIILPFQSNEAQRQAVEKALRHRVSVIDGPPGTGKTETILNLIANIVTRPGCSVGVVSFGNSAVDNVQAKLQEAGIGFIAARLGSSRERVPVFLAEQEQRNAALRAWQDAQKSAEAQRPQDVPGSTSGDALRHAEQRLTKIWSENRQIAVLRQELAAYRLEAEHFERVLLAGELADLSDLPLLKRSSDRILSYLAETSVPGPGSAGLRSIPARIRRYFQYGRLKQIDPHDTATVQALERAFYAKRIGELMQKEAGLVADLSAQSPQQARQEHQALSWQVLNQALSDHYSRTHSFTFDDKANSTRRHCAELLAQYPVILTTCRSIRSNLGDLGMLDWLIIDEASQTNLPDAALAMSKARHVVVVGDLKQLDVTLDRALQAELHEERLGLYDASQSILESVTTVYGERVSRTMLTEHYRCEPAIIEFCNQMYYDGTLIPMRQADPSVTSPLSVIRTAPGNHARRVTTGLARGTYNQREIEVIGHLLAGDSEQADQAAHGEAAQHLGLVTPFRLQADRLNETTTAYSHLPAGSADTVHRFQGRGRDTIIMSTVVDQSRQGRMGLQFADDPRLINVAVSRAKKKFILVTHNGPLRGSRNIQDLVDYIVHQNPSAACESPIVSVFDLLYREHSQRLEHFAKRVHGTSRYLSENIMNTLLEDILTHDEAYQHLSVQTQVRLHSLVPPETDLDERQRHFLRTVSSVDFAIYHRVTKVLILAIEVDGFQHENNADQRRRDATKDSILSACGIPLLRLPTNHSGESKRIQEALDQALAG